MDQTSSAKKAAAAKAVEMVTNGMTVGLGTGTTAYWAIILLAERIKKEGLKIVAQCSSVETEHLAKENGIPLFEFSQKKRIDITIDGADEIDEKCNLIKGGGGALLREKILASNARKFIVIADEKKLVKTLGFHALPVEILQFAYEFTLRSLTKTGCTAVLRMKEGKTFISDNGNFIADCQFKLIEQPKALNQQLKNIPGVLETGLFPKKMVHKIFVGRDDGKVIEF